jgi:hypothetical protein
MKKIIAAAIFTVIYQAYAIFGVGVHLGVDNTSVDGQKVEFLSINELSYTFGMERTAFNNPLAFGAQMYLDIPVLPIGFELGFEGAWASYKWTADSRLTGPNGEDINLEIPGYSATGTVYDEQFEFAKIGVDLTGKWYVFSLPPVVNTFKFYVGGGAGFYFITPIVTDKMIIAELEKKYEGPIPTTSPVSFDVDEYVEKVTVFGTHLVAGMRLKIPVLPVSFNVDYKYVMTPENGYKDETNNFSVIKGSLNLYF